MTLPLTSFVHLGLTFKEASPSLNSPQLEKTRMYTPVECTGTWWSLEDPKFTVCEYLFEGH